MSLTVAQSLNKLRGNCSYLGIEVEHKSNKELKEAYILALRDYYIKKDFGGKLPKSLELATKIESPMLCQRYSMLKEEERDEIWNSDDWFVEEKEDGVRLLVSCIDGQLDFFSREISTENYLPMSYKRKIWGFEGLIESEDFLLDAELVSDCRGRIAMEERGLAVTSVRESINTVLSMNELSAKTIQKNEMPLTLKIFDCLWENGRWLLDERLQDRRRRAKHFVELMRERGDRANMPFSNISNKKAFLRAILGRGGEGVVAKRRDSKYEASSSRKRDGWIKIKRGAVLGADDTLDAFISGYRYKEDVLWLELSAYLDGDVRVITEVPVNSRSEERLLSDNGKLKSEIYGRVVELGGGWVSGDMIVGSRILDWREDRSHESCEIERSLWESISI